MRRVALIASVCRFAEKGLRTFQCQKAFVQPLTALPTKLCSSPNACTVRYFSGSATEHRMKTPSMGDSITEGTIASWKKNVGDFVREDEVVCQIETDKVTIDVHSKAAGKILALSVEQGGTVYVGGDLVTIDTSFADQARSAAGAAAPAPKPQPAAVPATPAPSAPASHAPIAGKLHYTPKIQFPDRLAGGGHAKHAASPSAAETSSPSPSPSTPKKTGNASGRPSVEVFDDWSQLPDRYKPKPISEAEIEIINAGGVEASTWSSKTFMVSPLPPAPKKKEGGDEKKEKKAKAAA